ncbi:response regulator [Planosporangium thailandense]|uniref:Response regulator n=2 Tax=Planosporangium thailandense TaxID=765197 RepID=A0ABX0YA11_9ACTN|nr:response regulator [Planosporangium thailandense]NJC74217.1 response regulator [Planosporangium thailandense]
MSARQRILCLDDAPYVLDGLRRHLHVDYNVVTTTQPHEALDLLAADKGDPIAVIITDIRMPQMTGVDVLKRARRISPDTTRVLLTGVADMRSAIAAINQGHVFRFMLKPCPPEDLKATIAAAATQSRLVRAERELLEATLKGCVDALVETLAMAQPALFSRASRLRRLVQRVCQQLGVVDSWQIEMAAQMGEIGAITLPPSAIAVLEGGTPNSPAEADMLASLPKLADDVLARIPCLDAVREIVRHQLPTDRNPMVPLRPHAPSGAWLLQAVREYDALVWRGMPRDVAIAALSSRKIHSRDLLIALAVVGWPRLSNDTVREVDLDELALGDELAGDVYSAKGMLLVTRGQVITDRLLIRLRNYEVTGDREGPVFVVDA